MIDGVTPESVERRLRKVNSKRERLTWTQKILIGTLTVALVSIPTYVALRELVKKVDREYSPIEQVDGTYRVSH